MVSQQKHKTDKITDSEIEVIKETLLLSKISI